jgi:lysyl-tRNA synthetase, class II
VPMLYKSGIPSVEVLKDSNPNKVLQDLCSLNKKMKLGLKNPTKEEVKAWIDGKG